MSTAVQSARIRGVEAADLEALWALEQACFAHDRLSRRRLKHWIAAQNRVFLVLQQGTELLGYGLVLLHRGTKLARLYSIALLHLRALPGQLRLHLALPSFPLGLLGGGLLPRYPLRLLSLLLDPQLLLPYSC